MGCRRPRAGLGECCGRPARDQAPSTAARPGRHLDPGTFSPHRRIRVATMRTRMTLTAAALLAAGTLLGTPATPAPSHAPPPAGDTADDVRLAKKVAALVAQDERRLVEIFKYLHANPELGF